MIKALYCPSCHARIVVDLYPQGLGHGGTRGIHYPEDFKPQSEWTDEEAAQVAARQKLDAG